MRTDKSGCPFKSWRTSSPSRVARQVKPLKELLDLKTRLNDLKGTLQTNESWMKPCWMLSARRKS